MSPTHVKNETELLNAALTDGVYNQMVAWMIAHADRFVLPIDEISLKALNDVGIRIATDGSRFLQVAAQQNATHVFRVLANLLNIMSAWRVPTDAPFFDDPRLIGSECQAVNWERNLKLARVDAQTAAEGKPQLNLLNPIRYGVHSDMQNPDFGGLNRSEVYSRLRIQVPPPGTKPDEEVEVRNRSLLFDFEPSDEEMPPQQQQQQEPEQPQTQQSTMGMDQYFSDLHMGTYNQ